MALEEPATIAGEFVFHIIYLQFSAKVCIPHGSVGLGGKRYLEFIYTKKIIHMRVYPAAGKIYRAITELLRGFEGVSKVKGGHCYL